MSSNWLKNYTLITFEQIDSTNSEALRLANARVSGNFVILAKNQTGGRGQKGKSWVSMPGNLHSSILIEIDVVRNRHLELSFLAANSLYEAICFFAKNCNAHFQMDLKWPNDVLINSSKVAGILLESIAFGDKSYVVIGFGVNVKKSPSDLEKDSTSLQSHQIYLDQPEDFLDVLMKKFDKLYNKWLHDDSFENTRLNWTKRAYRLNQHILVKEGKEQLSGVFTGINNNGAMIIQNRDGVSRVIHSGEIIMNKI